MRIYKLHKNQVLNLYTLPIAKFSEICYNITNVKTYAIFGGKLYENKNIKKSADRVVGNCYACMGQ
mgnify:CR=1 FL=1